MVPCLHTQFNTHQAYQAQKAHRIASKHDEVRHALLWSPRQQGQAATRSGERLSSKWCDIEEDLELADWLRHAYESKLTSNAQHDNGNRSQFDSGMWWRTRFAGVRCRRPGMWCYRWEAISCTRERQIPSQCIQLSWWAITISREASNKYAQVQSHAVMNWWA